MTATTQEKQEYKKTELGWIPEDWDVIPLKDCVRDFIVPMRDKPKTFNGEIPWCRIEDFNGKYLNDSKSGQYVDEETVKSMNLKIYPVGTVLCSCSATLGYCAITTKLLLTNQTFIGLYPKENLEKEFLYYLMIYNASKLQKLSTGTTIAYLPRVKFEHFKIAFPNLNEQKKIAMILSQVDEKIEKVDNQIKQAEQLKKALMQELLTKGIGHTEFKDTAIGKIPQKWQVMTLLEFASKEKNAIVDGPFGSNLKTEHYRTEGIPIIQSGFVTNNKFIANNYIYVDKEKFEKEIRSKVSPNDIVMAKIGANCGRCAIMPQEHSVGILAGNSLKITVGTNNSTYYLLKLLHYYLETGKFEELISRTAQPALSIGRLKSLKIPCPALLEQVKIASIAESIDEKIKTLQNKKTEYEKLKKGLMQKLLTGQLRVTTNN